MKKNSFLEKIKVKINTDVVLEKLQSEYGEEVSKLLDFNEFNIGEKLQMNSFHQENFRLLYIAEKQKLCRLQDNFDERAGQKYDKYKYGNSKDLSKVEIERYYLPKDEELIKLKKIIRLQETRVEFFSAVADSFKSQGFNMRVFMDNLKVGG